MRVELFGCTGAGKSTLAQRMRRRLRSRGVKAFLAEEFVIRQVRLGWLPVGLLRTLLVDLCAIIACVLTCRANLRLYLFSFRIILQLPGEVAWPERLNLARNVLKKTGIDEIIRHRGSGECLILIDEGTLHAVHNLFVHLAIPPNDVEIARFARIVSLPDVAIYVKEAESILMERTLARGHNRVDSDSRHDVTRFVERAIAAFDQLVRELLFQNRVRVVDGGVLSLARPNCQGEWVSGVVEVITGLDLNTIVMLASEGVEGLPKREVVRDEQGLAGAENDGAYRLDPAFGQ